MLPFRVLPAPSVLMFVAAFLVPAAHAGAGLSYMSQVRRVEVSALGTPQASFEAPDYGIFDRTAQWTDPVEGHGGSAMQHSELKTDGVTLSSTLSAADGRSGFNASAASVLDVLFSLDRTSGAAMTGSWMMNTPLAGVVISGQVRLSRDGDPVWAAPINAGASTFGLVPFGFAGELEPGTYRLELRANLTASLVPGFTSGSGSLAATFAIPSPTGAGACGAGMLGVLGLGRSRRAGSFGAMARL